MSCPIIIDGPNFINRLLDNGISKRVIIKYLNLSNIKSVLQRELPKDTLHNDTIEFLHSSSQFGDKANKFTFEEQKRLLTRWMFERGVHIDKIHLEGSEGRKEKGVDIALASRLWKRSTANNFIAFISEDRDFIPVLRDMRELGIRIVICSYSGTPTIEVMNEAYQYIDLRKYNSYLFRNNNKINDLHINTITTEDVCHMIMYISDNMGKITMNENGEISHDYGGSNYYHDSFNLYSYIANGNMRGAAAASDENYLQSIIENMKKTWETKQQMHHSQEVIRD